MNPDHQEPGIHPWLWLPPKWSHDIGQLALRFLGRLQPVQIDKWQSFKWQGLEFANPLGVAGGLDKNGYLVKGLWSIGAGFVEIGTVTPRPQSPNRGRLFDRDYASKSIWNRLGFPSIGGDKVLARLRSLDRPFPTPVFLNIGKNRDTELHRAHEDYVELITKFEGLIDAFVVNVSSPNTLGLRELLRSENLKVFLEPIITATKTPVLLKLSPDATDDEIKSTLDTSYEIGISGWILTNTTQARPGELQSRYPADGGVSGLPLAERSKDVLKLAVHHLGSRRENKLIVSVGGVMTAQDVFERLRLGAQLVQVYSTLVFNGPGFFHEVANRARYQNRSAKR